MESLFERRRPIKKRSPKSIAEERVVFRDEQTRKAIALVVPAAALTLMPKEASATQEAEFGPDVNDIHVVDEQPREAYSARLMPGPTPNSFTMTFQANSPNDGNAIYEAGFDFVGRNPIRVRQLGDLRVLSDDEGVNSIMFLDRGDGRKMEVKQTAGDEILIDGVNKWDVGGNCRNGGLYEVTSTADFRGLKIPVSLRVPAGTTMSDDIWTWQYDPAVSDICVALKDRVGTNDPWQTGDLRYVESSQAYDDMVSVETNRFAATTRRRPDDSQPVHLLEKDTSTTPISYQYMRQVGDRWSVENPQTGTPDVFGYAVDTMLKRTHPDGGEFHMIVTLNGGTGMNRYILKLRLPELQPDGSLIEQPLAMEKVANPPPPDGDGDGVIDDDDNCEGRANTGGVDNTGPNGVPDGIGDACQADCTGNFPGIDPVGEVNSSGLRVCQSELGYLNAVSFEDGSTPHSNMEIVYQNGQIQLQPGQTLEFIHSTGPGLTPQDAPDISVPSGNSVKFKIFDTAKLDGTPGSVSFTHHPWDNPSATETNTFTNPVTDWREYGVGTGDVMGLEGCHVLLQAGTENLTPTCMQEPALCPVPDGGTSDGGNSSDAGTGGTDSGTSTDSGSPANDGGTPGEDAGSSSDAGAEEDGGASDSGNSEDAGADSGLTGSDSGTAEDSGTTGGDSGAGEDAGAREDAGPPTDSGNPETDAGNHGSPDSGGADDGGQDAGRTGTDSGEATDAASTDAASTQDGGQTAHDSGNLPDGGPKADQDAGRTGHNNDGSNGNNENPDPGGCGCEIQAPDTQSCSIQAPDHQNHAPLATMDASLGMLGALALAGTSQSVRRRIAEMWGSLTA